MKKIIVLIITACIALSSLSYAALTVVDPIFQQNLNGKKAILTYIINNPSSQSITAEVTPSTLVLGSKFGAFAHDKAITSTSNNYAVSDSEMRISPKRLRIPAKKSRTVRVLVNIKNPTDGTFYGNIKIAELPKKNNIQRNNSGKNIEAGVNFLVNQYASFYLTKGKGSAIKPTKASQKLSVTCSYNSNEKLINIKYKNNTNYLFRPLVVVTAAGQEIYKQIPAPVAPLTQAERNIALTNINLPNTKSYSLKFIQNNKSVLNISCD